MKISHRKVSLNFCSFQEISFQISVTKERNFDKILDSICNFLDFQVIFQKTSANFLKKSRRNSKQTFFVKKTR